MRKSRFTEFQIVVIRKGAEADRKVSVCTSGLGGSSSLQSYKWALISFVVLCLMLNVSVSSSAELSQSTGTAHVVVETSSGSLQLAVHYARPSKLPLNRPVLVVMHGNQRNAVRYRDVWAKHARELNIVVLVPEFSRSDFQDWRHYNLGNSLSSSNEITPNVLWHFGLIEKIVDVVRSANGINASRYLLYGHSAGAQFVHRMILIERPSRVLLAVAANAGWYTAMEQSVPYPYGLGGLGLSERDIATALSIPMVVALGARDSNQHAPWLRITREAMRQGSHRLARGQFFLHTAAHIASTLNVSFNWRAQIISDAGHSNSEMATEVAKIFDRELTNHRE